MIDKDGVKELLETRLSTQTTIAANSAASQRAAEEAAKAWFHTDIGWCDFATNLPQHGWVLFTCVFIHIHIRIYFTYVWCVLFVRSRCAAFWSVLCFVFPLVSCSELVCVVFWLVCVVFVLQRRTWSLRSQSWSLRSPTVMTHCPCETSVC